MRVKEDKARDKWWHCEKISLAKFNTKYGTKAKKKKSKKKNKTRKTVQKKSSAKHYKAPTYSQHKPMTFTQGRTITTKGNYQGEKQRAWLAFYRKPSKCLQPKSMSVLVYCSEDKVQQKSEFNKTYQE